MASSLNTAFIKLNKRAESSAAAQLISTFVDVGPLFTLLSNPNDQVIYGRRGTGKTHALYYLLGAKSELGDLPIYIDMRSIGSTGGIYGDQTLPLGERATRLLQDVLISFHDGIRDFLRRNLNSFQNPQEVLEIVDTLSTAITEVRVHGNINVESNREKSGEIKKSSSFGLDFKEGRLGGSASLQSVDAQANKVGQKISESGPLIHRVHFGRVSSVLKDVMLLLGKRKVWLLLDEWSSLPLDLQPYLADLLRRSIAPVNNIVIKVAAIEQRSKFILKSGGSDYIGFELGADIAADINLDDFMVFDNDTNAARIFFKELLFRHCLEVENIGNLSSIKNSDRIN